MSCYYIISSMRYEQNLEEGKRFIYSWIQFTIVNWLRISARFTFAIYKRYTGVLIMSCYYIISSMSYEQHLEEGKRFIYSWIQFTIVNWLQISARFTFAIYKQLLVFVLTYLLFVAPSFQSFNLQWFETHWIQLW